MCVCVCVCIYIYIYICVCVCVCVCVYTHIYIYIYIYGRVCAYVCFDLFIYCQHNYQASYRTWKEVCELKTVHSEHTIVVILTQQELKD